jgi:hypothetical protein
MAHEYPSTTAVARAGGATASSPAASSFPTAFQNDHEQWDVTDNSARPIPYGRFNGLLNTKIGGRSSPCRSRARYYSPSRASGTLSNPVTLPLGRISPACDGNLRAGAFHGCRPLFHSVAFGGSRRLQPQSLPHQQLVNSIADRLEAHVSNVLSNPSSTAGSINASKRGQKIGNSGQKGGA